MSDLQDDKLKASPVSHIEDLEHVRHLDDNSIPDTKHQEGVLTVLGTSGQDPNEKKTVGVTEYIILALSALAQFQNVVRMIPMIRRTVRLC